MYRAILWRLSCRLHPVRKANQMNILYSLLLVVQNVSGQDSTFVVDYNLIAKDCARIQMQWEDSAADPYAQVYCEMQLDFIEE